MRVHLLDPSAYSPPYDHQLAAALAQAGADVRLLTSAFAYGEVPTPAGYAREEFFYRHARGPAGSRRRAVAKLAEHFADMLRYRRATEEADVVHVQWLTVPQIDLHLLPDRPTVLTLHDPLPRRLPIRLSASGRLSNVDAIVVHSEHARRAVMAEEGFPSERVRVIRHGALSPTAGLSAELPGELGPTELPVVLCFGLIRPYKGIEVLLEAWNGIRDAQLWVVGRPMMDLAPLRAAAPSSVQFVPRFVTAAEEAGLYARADIAVVPYVSEQRFSFSGALATALGAGRAIVVSDLGGLSEVAESGAAVSVPAGDAAALRSALQELIDDPVARRDLAQAAEAAAADTYSWESAARATLELYHELVA